MFVSEWKWVVPVNALSRFGLGFMLKFLFLAVN